MVVVTVDQTKDAASIIIENFALIHGGWALPKKTIKQKGKAKDGGYKPPLCRGGTYREFGLT